jgi:hypothetical protein
MIAAAGPALALSARSLFDAPQAVESFGTFLVPTPWAASQQRHDLARPEAAQRSSGARGLANPKGAKRRAGL